MLRALALGEPRHRLLQDQRLEVRGLAVIGEGGLVFEDLVEEKFSRLFARLMEQDIVTSFRDSNMRATIHFYNTEDDIDTFVAAMKASRAEFHPTP